MTISQRIFEVLDQKGITQSELSRGTGINARAISDWRTKGTNPSADKISQICSFLGVTADWLLNGEDKLYTITNNGAITGSTLFQGNHSVVAVINKVGETTPITEEASDLIRIHSSLSPRRRNELMMTAYKLEDENKKAESNTSSEVQNKRGIQ